VASLRGVRWILGMALAVVCACSSDSASIASHQPPALTKGSVERLIVRADEIKREALFAHESTRLGDVFRRRALQVLGKQVHGMAVRGLSVEERDATGTLVYWDPRAYEAVLQVVARRRLVSSDQPNPIWAATIRQWWARFEYSDANWWIVDQDDLTPDRWRAAPPGG
jgi:hypothetical protein